MNVLINATYLVPCLLSWSDRSCWVASGSILWIWLCLLKVWRAAIMLVHLRGFSYDLFIVSHIHTDSDRKHSLLLSLNFEVFLFTWIFKLFFFLNAFEKCTFNSCHTIILQVLAHLQYTLLPAGRAILGNFASPATWILCSVHILRRLRHSYIIYNCQNVW